MRNSELKREDFHTQKKIIHITLNNLKKLKSYLLISPCTNGFSYVVCR